LLNSTRDRNKSLTITQLPNTTNYTQSECVHVNTGASEDGRLVRARNRRRSTDASPRLFRISTCCGQRWSGLRHRHLTSQPGAQGVQWNKRGSNFNIERVTRFVLSVHPYRPLHGSTFVLTPEFLAKKQCLINVQNNDEKCFVWSVLSALYPPTHNPHRLTNYIDYERSLNVEGLNFPVETKQIPLFEKLNPSISINVLAFEESSKGFTVEYRSPEREREHHVNLLEDADNPPNDITFGSKTCPP